MQLLHSMSTAFSLWPFLYLLLAPSTWAGPPSTEFLTPRLQQVIPPCAQTCLEFFIAASFPYPTCGPPPNFDCLCTSDSTTGFTVGEGALECLYASCESIMYSEAASVYDVCMTVESAKPNTHSTLTATASPPTPTTTTNSASQTSNNSHFSTPISSSFESSSPSVAASSTGLSVSTAITSALSTSFHPLSSSTGSPQATTPPAGGIITLTTSTRSSHSPTSSATAAPASSPAPVLTKPQIAGVVVSSIGAAAIGFGLCFLVFYLRRRRSSKRRHSGSSFGGDKIIPSEETTPDMSAIAARDFEYEHHIRHQPTPRRQRSPTRHLRLETPASSSENAWGQYRKDMAPEQIGLALGPQAPRSLKDEHSPITPASNRTRNSQLLPDKPTYSLFPSPLRTTPRNSIPNQIIRPPGNSPKPAVPPLGSPFARSAPQHPSSMDTSQRHLQGGSASRAPDSDPFTDASNRSPPNIYAKFRESRSRPPPPSTRHEPRTVRIPSWEQPPSAGVVRKPVATYQPYRIRGADPPPSSNRANDVTVIEGSHRRKPSRKSSSASRPVTFFSTESETSFESLDDEDDEPRDPRSALSPVAERRSPRAGRVSYPAIPVSAAESPSRKPQERHLHPAESDSLLSKRLGQSKAKEIADRLRDPLRQTEENEARSSAKRKVLVSPGVRGIDRSTSPPSAISAVKSPPTPWRR